MQMDSSFLTTLSKVVNGAKAIEEFTSTIVGAAIEDVLLRVARDHGLDYSKLVDEYKDDVLDKHALLGTGNVKCKGFTDKKQPCGRRAVCRGYCRGHSSQGAERETKDRKGVSYVTKEIKKKTDEPVVNALKKLGSEIVPAADMMISKSDVLEF
jgi:hypothetical protein